MKKCQWSFITGRPVTRNHSGLRDCGAPAEWTRRNPRFPTLHFCSDHMELLPAHADDKWERIEAERSVAP
jgi:hypothetical protein